MKIPSIKKLLHHTEEGLENAIQNLTEGRPLPFEVEGKDEGEKLTHLLSALEIKKNIQKGISLEQAIREFIQRVRKTLN